VVLDELPDALFRQVAGFRDPRYLE
jgi:hypothetical protein